MRRLVLRVLFVVAGLIGIGTFLVWQLLRGSLPLLDGDVAVGSLSAPVVIERDDAGIPTIVAKNRADLAFATGYVHGQDRYFQMDLLRRKAAGELAALVGPVAVALDRQNRLHRFRHRAAVVLERFSDTEKALLDAYASGVNAAQRDLLSRPFEYILLRAEPAPWRAEDTLLVLYAMFIELHDERADRDLRLGHAHRGLPPDVYAWLYPDGTAWDAPLSGEPRPALPVPGPESYDLRGFDAPYEIHVDTESLPRGSNNWALAGELTVSGRAIVANDMHLDLAVPTVFYRVRLVVDGGDARDISGVTLPGAPVVVAGSNGHVAWGLTNSYGDWSDAVIVRRGSAPGTYVTPDGERRFVEHRERIEVRGGDVVTLAVQETVWGPLRDDTGYLGAPVAIRWTAHAPEAINLAQLELETVADVGQALDAGSGLGIPPQNFIAGDADGNIGWTVAGRIPLRGDSDPRFPADWSREGGWTGWLPPASNPRIVNPPGGRLWTANSRVVDGAALALIGDGGYALGARARQIRDGLHLRSRVEARDMLSVHLDDRALFLDPWRELLLALLDDAAVDGDVARAGFRRLIDKPMPRAAPGSVEFRLVRAFYDDVRRRAFGMLMTPVRAAYGKDVPLQVSRQFDGALWSLVTEQPAHLLTANFASWRDFLLQSVDRTISALTADGSTLSAQTWGKANSAAIRHPLSAGLPMLARWLDMPRDALPGDRHMPRVQGPSFGAAERFAVSPGDEAGGYLHMPGGQSGHPLSDFYRRGHGDWVDGAPSAFLPGPPRHRLRLTPATP